MVGDMRKVTISESDIVDIMEDQCGLEPQEDDWKTLEDMPETLKGVLAEIGRVYIPALLANAQAVQAGEKTWESNIDGSVWTQQTFPYQAKCLKWINEQYQALSSTDRARVDTTLAGTGCEAVLLGKNLHLRRHHRVFPNTPQSRQIRVVDDAQY